MSTTVAIWLGVGLLIANAFFVGAEFAVMSARRSAIEPLAEAGNKRAKTVLWAMEHVSLMLACAQLGITVCSISLGMVVEPALAHLMEPWFAAWGLPEAMRHPLAVVIALMLVVYLHVVLGEMVPKNLAVTTPDTSVLWFGPVLVFIARVLRPLIWVMDHTANLILRMFGVEPKSEIASAFTAEEVQSIVARSQQEGLLEDAQGLLTGALEFSDRTAQDVMVPKERLITLTDPTPASVEAEVAQTGFSRFPVYGAHNIPIGYVHVKDVLYALEAERTEPLALYRLRALAVVEPDTAVEDVLATMQHSGTHLARVQSAEGYFGVVFLEDILEELVGEVRDEMQKRDRLRRR